MATRRPPESNLDWSLDIGVLWVEDAMQTVFHLFASLATAGLVVEMTSLGVDGRRNGLEVSILRQSELAQWSWSSLSMRHRVVTMSCPSRAFGVVSSSIAKYV